MYLWFGNDNGSCGDHNCKKHAEAWGKFRPFNVGDRVRSEHSPVTGVVRGLDWDGRSVGGYMTLEGVEGAFDPAYFVKVDESAPARSDS